MRPFGSWHPMPAVAAMSEKTWRNWPRRNPIAYKIAIAIPLVLAEQATETAFSTTYDASFVKGIVFMVYLGIFGCLSLLAGKPSPEVEALMDDADDAEHFVVDATFKAGRLTYGNDAGIVSFVGAWLVYEGLRTRFSLRASDVFREEKRRGKESGWVLTIREGDSSIEVALAERQPYGNRFDSHIETWQIARQEPGSPVLPPFALSRETRKGAVSLLKLCLLGSSLIPVAFALRTWPPLATLVLTGGVIGIVFAPYFLWWLWAAGRQTRRIAALDAASIAQMEVRYPAATQPETLKNSH